jgi:tetratricopeptide (TPR) repeat protein
LAYVDQLMGRFRQTLEATGWWRKALVILLADHGESLGDHGEMSHGYFIYESTLHVPLIVHWPESAPHPARSSTPAGLIDVAPTILDALHIAAPASFHGVSLLKDPGEIYSESVFARDSFHWAALRSLRKGDWKYIDAPRPELYDLAKDPREQTNVIRANPAQAAALRSDLQRFLARHARGPEPARDTSAQTRAELGSLGYISGSAGARGTGPDPKDRLAEFQTFDKGLDALYSERFDAAIRLFRQVLAMDKDNLQARGTLGDAFERAGKPEDAVREWSAALAADPKYAAAAQALGEHYLAAHDWEKARKYLAVALAAAPGDATIRALMAVAERNLAKP